MRTVYKCKSCDSGPCYCCTSYRPNADFYGEFSELPPMYCPYFMDSENPEWEVSGQDINPTSIRYLDQIQEWINSDGWDDAPEDLREGILACDLYPPRFQSYDLLRIFNFLRNHEENIFTGQFEMEDFQKELNKIKKTELIAAIFPEAFKAGIIYGEMLRQRRESKSNGEKENNK